MSLPQSFLDDIRARSVLSGFVARSVKLTRAGREMKGCCPFHNEKTPSFTVNDDKGFYHCFGCGAHGDVILWLTDHDGLPFMDAVRTLAEAAGMTMPARDPASQQKAEQQDRLRPALEAAERFYRAMLDQSGEALEYLHLRGISETQAQKFGIGYAPRGKYRLKSDIGVSESVLIEAGLLAVPEGGGAPIERFRNRIMFPVHDARGRLCGFGGRVMPGAPESAPKYLNSPEGPMFDKGRLLYNLHRAAPHARPGPGRVGRLVLVEGYMDVVALDAVGLSEVVAPMGTALTDPQLAQLWRVHPAPILLNDGDKAGRAASVRACERALVHYGPGQSLAVALMPAGVDPDDLARRGGREALDGVLASARPMEAFLFDALCKGGV